MNSAPKSVDYPPEEPPRHGGNGAANGGLTSYRLNELDRRMAAAEASLGEIRNACTRIETKLDNMDNNLASKTYVLKFFGGTLVLLLVSAGIHLLIRYIPS